MQFARIEHIALDALVDLEGRLPMVVDRVDIDAHRRVVRGIGHLLRDHLRGAPGTQRDITSAENQQRHLRAFAQPGQRPAIELEADQNSPIAGPDRPRHRDRVRRRIGGHQHGDSFSRPLG
ncbi:hypothetical protein [Nocardia brasiliensis]|uniref:Uncharacterized protein n=1 Tax=Nocardia brasiliensis (strain ATCC 700358 / HUJEG-1) TaxID=1133849 RepID=K0FCP8_NOCB7|nr:hypothetical protein [Nocardia brasiliensis]AFU05331.1 hypothetical protein O3I_036920 [Nocardia brasiliensis ATCC 700358]OCF87959.1 hypothetical protein AW168_23230 [Nocardia brasiliensis]